MASLRGQRFHIPLDTDAGDDEYDDFEKGLATEEDESSTDQAALPPLSAFANLVGDIKERPSAAPVSSSKFVLPKAPRANSAATGFPQPRKRAPVSRFKSRRQQDPLENDDDEGSNKEDAKGATSKSSSVVPPLSSEETTRLEIDRENKAKLAGMSQGEIARERSELMNSLSPSLVQKLLKRSTIDDVVTANEDDFPLVQSSNVDASNDASEPGSTTTTGDSAGKHSKKVTFDDSSLLQEDPIPTQRHTKDDETTDQDLDDRPAPPSVLENPPQIHFPKPVQPPDLDPSDPEFFDSLHEKYFPSLPADPSKLAWMTGSAGDGKSYDPNAESLQASQLRFGFKGELLAPRTAQSIPVTKGLHHHGDAPDSAGYTVRELAHLSRSSVPTQRCIAYQVLGRLMYRLGKGEYGDDELCKGLWRCLEEGRVLDTLQGEVDKKSGHMSAKAYATDALWLWQRGGGKRLGTG